MENSKQCKFLVSSSNFFLSAHHSNLLIFDSISALYSNQVTKAFPHEPPNNLSEDISNLVSYYIKIAGFIIASLVSLNSLTISLNIQLSDKIYEQC